MTPPNNSLVVSLLKPEEAPQYMRIRHETFKADVNKILYANAKGYEPSQKTLDAVTDSIRDGVINNEILYLKCVDTATGEMIAGARWNYIRPKTPGATRLTSEEVEAQLSISKPYDESHPEIWYEFFELFHDNRREYLGDRPYYMLETLVTHPKHHRRGAGGMLVGWGCAKADEAGVEAYIEASPMGEPLYARYGFQPIKQISLDLRRWRGDEEIQWTLMIRPVRTFDVGTVNS